MKTIQLQSEVGDDGVLSLEVPLGATKAKTCVIVTIGPLAGDHPLGNSDWYDFVRKTYGTKKAAYDMALRERHHPKAVERNPCEQGQSPLATLRGSLFSRAAYSRGALLDARVIAGGSAAILIFFGLAIWASNGSSPAKSNSVPERHQPSRSPPAGQGPEIRVPSLVRPALQSSDYLMKAVARTADEDDIEKQPRPGTSRDTPFAPAPQISPSVSATPDSKRAEAPEARSERRGTTPQSAGDGRLPAPSDAARAKAMKLAKEVYKDEYQRAKTTAAKQALASKILKQGQQTKDDADLRFILFTLAAEIAAGAGDCTTAFDAAEEEARLYQVDVVESKANVMFKVLSAVRTSVERKAAVARARTLMEEAADAENYDLAEQIGLKALAEARKSRDDELARSVICRGKDIRARRTEFEAYNEALEELKRSPNDPKMSLVVGKYFCLTKGDWERGLPHLANGSDEQLKAAARHDLHQPTNADDEVELGTAWWTLAKAGSSDEPADNQRRALLLRAGAWYRESLADLPDGLRRTMVESRLAEIIKTGAAIPVARLGQGHAGPAPAVAPFSAAEGRQHQQAWAKHLHVPTNLVNSLGMQFALVPPGEFDMGSTEQQVSHLLEEAKRHQNTALYVQSLPHESPRHRVKITKPFFLGVYEVTQAEYACVMETNPSNFQGDMKRPVEQVSWHDATAFCRRLSELPAEKLAGRRYGLPTEAQWEYSCRAGSTTRYYSGDNEASLSQYAWFSGNSSRTTHAVGEKRPNGWGLYDMHGNVWEWCSDYWAEGFYGASPSSDPTGPPRGPLRILRGGGWGDLADGCRSAVRLNAGPIYTGIFLGVGFRVSLVSLDKIRE